MPQTPAPPEAVRVIERPDGFYWQDESRGEFGPFGSLAEAMHDMEASTDEEFQVDDIETLEEAEAEFGVGWIDPLTGEPGEDGAPRLEEH